MRIKNLILAAAVMLSAGIPVFSADNTEQTDLRTMFQNNQAVIYVINLRTFNADDKNGNGIIDFELGETSGSFINAIDRLDELKALGVNAVHLLPFTPIGRMKALGNAGSLYAIADFRSFNLQLSDSESNISVKKQAEQFVQECHKRGIKVIADLPSCGAYDYFLDRPDLFVQNSDGSSVIPADWMDVRLFNVPDDDSLLSSDIFIMHKRFVNNMLDIGIDGIRADVASIKPYIFWKELIKYTRSRKPDFFFLAEASEAWTKPVSSRGYFTDYKKLMEAGFDGYYGNYFDFKNWKTADKLHNAVLSKNKIFKKYKEKKSVIGSFATHDEISPLITGGEAFSKMIIWLNETLPLNPYYVDGFLQGDDYSYDYAEKKAAETFTDSDTYYVHKGQIDIFNFSRRPGGSSDVLLNEYAAASKIRSEYSDVIEQGKYIPIKTDSSSIFAYQRYLNGRSVIVMINRNLITSEEFKAHLEYINKKSRINFVKNTEEKNLEKSIYKAVLKPGGIAVITIN